jgi:hypothetical protein
MPRPRIDRYWQERIRELTEQNPRLSSTKIAARLEEEAHALERADWPSEKACRNYMALHRNAPEEERRQYRLARWPESFGTPDLPWEAAPAVLEAVRVAGEAYRPTVRTVKWYWRLTLAWPESQPEDRLEMARVLAVAEATDPAMASDTVRAIESILLHRTPPPSDGSDRTVFLVGTTREGAGWTPGAADIPLTVPHAGSDGAGAIVAAVEDGLLDRSTGEWLRNKRASDSTGRTKGQGGSANEG